MSTTAVTATTDPIETDGSSALAEIDTLRGQINAIDDAIARLVTERAALSRRVQTARVNAGGTRIELGREREILAGYRAALGPEGPSLGDAVLRVCRGAR